LGKRSSENEGRKKKRYDAKNDKATLSDITLRGGIF